MIQSVINIVYRYPKAKLNRYKQFGGYISYKKMLYDRNLMQKAAIGLAPVNSYPNGLPIYFLTGKNYLYQTLFCIQSLAKASTTQFKFILVDDGSFDARLIQQAGSLLPGSEIVTGDDIEKNLQQFLPENVFPVLHKKRREYPHIKKLTDVHTLPGITDWKLVLDSDMLFWNDPSEIINWLARPDKPLHMTDCTDSYGYSRNLMEKLAGTKITSLLNVGAIGLKSSSINWENLENWVKVLEEKENTSYYLEQALTAMLIGEKEATVLPADNYIVNPDSNTINNRKGILHHYVDLSKEGYFKQAWKMV